MNQITYGDYTSKATGHARDMHFGETTMPFNSRLKGYAVPGVSGQIPGLMGRVVTDSEARAMIERIAALTDR